MYFTVSVKVGHEDEKGRLKTTTERYLVDAMSVTEAESRVTTMMEKEGVQEFNVSTASQSKIIKVL